jgi:uncharacterized protein (UPF0297 family)
MKFQISEQVLQAVLNYLATKPFNEVNQLIVAIQSEVGPQVKKPEEPKKEKK